MTGGYEMGSVNLSYEDILKRGGKEGEGTKEGSRERKGKSGRL